MITIICEPAKKKENLEKLVKIFKDIKEKNKELEINLKVANRVDSMRGYNIKDDEILIVFGSNLYKHILRDIDEFDKMAGNPKRDVHKFSYFVRRDKKHYFIAFMPPIDFTMSKPETFLAFESFMTTLVDATNNFKSEVREAYLQKSVSERHKWPIDVVENGFSPRTKIYFNYDEIKAYLYNMFDLPDWTRVSIDVETNGLQIWDKNKHSVRIGSMATEGNVGHAFNLSLPGLVAGLANGQAKEIKDLWEKYLFEKPKTFIAWNCGFDIFSLCNFYGRDFKEFLKCNRIWDGMQLLHALSENRKVEGYNLKAASRDLLNYPQYSFVMKYIHYIENYKTYTIEQIMEAATNSLVYAAIDAAGEHALTELLHEELMLDPIAAKFTSRVVPRIMAVKLESEWNGITVDCEGLAKGSTACSGWELDNIVKPTLKKCQDSSDGKLHPELFVFSATSGRLYYGKPFLNGMKIGSKCSVHFKADPEHTLVYLDLDSADLRSAALIVQDENMINDLNEHGDFYMRFAKELFSGEIGEKERNIAKLFVLSMLNLAGDSTIANEAGVRVEDVKSYKVAFYNKYGKMLEYKNNLKDYLEKNACVFSTSFRKRRFSEDDLTKDNLWKSFLSAHNFPFQSTTADLMVLNCFRFLANTRQLKIKQCILNVDAAVFNVPNEHLDAAKVEFGVFATVPDIIAEGATLIQNEVFKTDVQTLLRPNFSYKLYKGQNMNEMERW
jgi:hypothetical protein